MRYHMSSAQNWGGGVRSAWLVKVAIVLPGYHLVPALPPGIDGATVGSSHFDPDT